MRDDIFVPGNLKVWYIAIRQYFPHGDTKGPDVGLFTEPAPFDGLRGKVANRELGALCVRIALAI